MSRRKRVSWEEHAEEMRGEGHGAAFAAVVMGLAAIVVWAFLLLALADLAGANPGLRSTYATSYCLQGRMADGTFVRPRSAASNVLRLGTRIRLVGRPFFRGMRRFVVRDTGGALGDGHLDLWHPSCSASRAWGRRGVRYKLGWGRP